MRGDLMRRRSFLTLLGTSVAAWPLAARAQQRAMPVIGYLDAGEQSDSERASPGFRQGLREAGLIEGQNIAIVYRWAENQGDRLPELARELVQRRVAALVTVPNNGPALAAKAATSTIPIVFMCAPDPVRTGVVASLNRPGGNATGITLLSADLTAKRVGLLHDLAPQVKTIAILLYGNSPNTIFQLQEAESAGRNIGTRIIGVRAESIDNFDTAFATAVRDGAGALLVSAHIFFVNNRDRLAALAAAHKLPVMYQQREYTAAGGLMSYGPNEREIYRQVGLYTGRILKGEKPSDLPVMQPTRFEFMLNLKTAKALDLTIPPGILAIVDEVIE
jgi:putative tryptophan/tyrosine transport system substrate-binding protein